MKAALLAEYRKLVSTRIWWILLLVMVPYLVFVSAAIAASFTLLETEGAPLTSGLDTALSVYSLLNGIGYVFPLVIGSLAMTTEFRHKTITQSLLVEPNRTRFLVAKLISVVPIGLVAGLLGALGVVLGGAPLLAAQGDGAFLGNSEVITTLLLGVLVIALWTIIGVAFGSVLSNQVAAIVVILAFTQFVEPIARVVLNQVDALTRVASFLPGGAADTLIGGSFLGDPTSVELIPRWLAAVVLVGYAVLFAVIGRLTTLRRDIN